MSNRKNNPSATEYLEKSEINQANKKKIINDAKKFKEDAMHAATQPMGFCLAITVLILVAVIAPVYLGVLAFIA